MSPEKRPKSGVKTVYHNYLGQSAAGAYGLEKLNPSGSGTISTINDLIRAANDGKEQVGVLAGRKSPAKGRPLSRLTDQSQSFRPKSSQSPIR